jgi:fucose 4-O-acetylase-like acetyltransferase
LLADTEMMKLKLRLSMQMSKEQEQKMVKDILVMLLTVMALLVTIGIERNGHDNRALYTIQGLTSLVIMMQAYFIFKKDVI